MKTWQIVVVVVVVVAVGVGGFFGGQATAGGKTPTVQEALQVIQAQQGSGSLGFQGANGSSATRRGGAVSGSIIAADSSSITVKLADGSTKIVLLSSSTTVSKVSDGSLSDLTSGQNVVVTGTANSDGSVSATRVQVGANLSTTGMPGPGDGGAPPSDMVPGGGGDAPGGSTTTSVGT